MFGYHKAKRAKKRLKRQAEEFAAKEKAWGEGAAQRDKEAEDLKNTQVSEKTSKSAEDRKNAYAEGRKRVQDLYNDPTIEGLSAEKRNALQYEANKGIQRSMQSANRKLLGDQAMHGVVGKGGVGYAQQRDLQKLGTEAQAGVHRDLDKMNADLRLKNIAAIFAGEQGEAAQAQLDKQLALDELNLNEEKKRQRLLEDQIYRQFSRV